MLYRPASDFYARCPASDEPVSQEIIMTWQIGALGRRSPNHSLGQFFLSDCDLLPDLNTLLGHEKNQKILE